MNHALPLDQMSVSDKLAVLEQLWQDLSGNPADVPAPNWHGEALASREARAREGQTVFRPLDEMKDRIRKEAR